MNKDAAWQTASRETLLALDIRAEYEAMGIQVTGKTPSSKGWLECRAIDRDDENPSAAINVGQGDERGRYNDMGGPGGSMGFWDFAATHGPYATWREARGSCAEKVGVKLPQGDGGGSFEELYEFSDLTAGALLLWTKRKPGVSPLAAKQAGGVAIRYPRKMPASRSQSLIGFPMYGPALLAGKVTAWHSVRSDGAKIEKYQGKGNRPKLIRMMVKGDYGLMNQWALQHWEAAEVVWVVEGLSDMLTLQGVLGDRTDHIVTSSGGCSYRMRDEWGSLFAGKDVRVCFDVDHPEEGHELGAGEEGANCWVSSLVGVAASVRKVVLPCELEPGVKSFDLRDYLERHTYADLLELSESIEPASTAPDSNGKASGDDPIFDNVSDDTLANATVLSGDGGDTTTVAFPLPSLVARTLKQTGDWPRRVGDLLFAEGDDGPLFLRKTPDVFAYLHYQIGRVSWHRGAQCATRDEFISAFRHRSTEYKSIERYPHFPTMPECYYSHPEVKLGDGSHMRALLEKFNPYDDVDYELLKAAIMTLCWGGPPGARPAFMFTAVEGRGVGKTKTAEAIAAITGGVFDFARSEDIESIKKRLLTGDVCAKRTCMLDNVKSHRFSWSEFESLVTAKEISGHQMYSGERTRLNNLCWMITLNGPALGRDIAQRVIPIVLDKPEKFDGRWIEDTFAMVEENRWAIIGDIAAAMAVEPVELETATRWASWERGVVSKLNNPRDIIQTVITRQSEFDFDSESESEIEDHFEKRLSEFGYETDKTWIHISNMVATKWYTEATGDRIGVSKMKRAIKQAFGEGLLKRMRENPCRAYGRGLLWMGPTKVPGQSVQYDLDDRINHVNRF